MKLKGIYIESYKHLHKFRLSFRECEDLLGNASVKFFIGRNGSGKSALLEVIGLIFTRVLQDESPGFRFGIKYSLFANGEEIDVVINNNRIRDTRCKSNHKTDGAARFQVYIKAKNRKRELLDLAERPFSNHIEYHPKRIIAYSAGPNSMMEDILVHTPNASLRSDIYDASDEVASYKDSEERQREIENCLKNLKGMADNPRCLFIDGKTAKLVLIALCAVIPDMFQGNGLTDSQRRYCEMRDMLVKCLGKNLKPIAFSIVADGGKLEENEEQDTHDFFRKLLYSEKRAGEKGISCLNDWVSIRNHNTENQQTVAVFNIVHEQGNEGKFFHAPRLRGECTPMELLTILLSAKYDGLLKEAHIAFTYDNCDSVLSQTALSDGEYLWLARMGLILMAQDEVFNNSLFLFDEPDVHLNETWIIDFIGLLHEFSRISEFPIRHDFIIATHSSLMLTDAPHNQLYHFKNKNGRIQVESGVISTFAADRDEITRLIFKPERLNEKYSRKLIDSIIKGESAEDIRKLIAMVGPGYDRFRLRDRLSELEEPDEE